MNIFEYADVLNLQIEITRHSNQDERWSAHFGYAEIKDGSMLVGVYGNGKNCKSAIDDYLSQICGKTLVMHAGSKQHRREFVVPKGLTS